MQRKGIRGWWRSTAGNKPTDVPSGAKLDRDLAIGRMEVGGVPMADSRRISSAPIIAAYTDSPADMTKFEGQLNRPVDVAVAFTDSDTIQSNDFPFWLQWPGTRKLILSQCLIANGWDMATTATGAHDSDYAEAADKIAEWQDRILSVRIGWEFNVTGGYPWTVGGPGASNQTAARYQACFHRFATMIRDRAPGVLIDWCPLADHVLPDPWYPGDDVVDIIGNDVYTKEEFHSGSFDDVLDWDAGLIWQEKFAQAHGKLMGFAEWATDYDGGIAEDFIKKMAAWMQRPRVNRVVYHGYWNSNQVVSTKLDDKPLNLAAYKAAFAEL